MIGWVDNIENVTLDNTIFRTVIHTGPHSQLTVMSIPQGEEIGWEAHSHLDQFLRVEQGRGRLDLGRSEDLVDESHDIEEDWTLIVPAGIWHNVVNAGDGDLKLHSIYSHRNTQMERCIAAKPKPTLPSTSLTAAQQVASFVWVPPSRARTPSHPPPTDA